MKRTQKYMSSEAHGYLREAEACSLVLKDLEHISAKLQRRIDREAAARQADFEAAMQYHSEAEIQAPSLKWRSPLCGRSSVI